MLHKNAPFLLPSPTADVTESTQILRNLLRTPANVYNGHGRYSAVRDLWQSFGCGSHSHFNCTSTNLLIFVIPVSPVHSEITRTATVQLPVLAEIIGVASRCYWTEIRTVQGSAATEVKTEATHEKQLARTTRRHYMSWVVGSNPVRGTRLFSLCSPDWLWGLVSPLFSECLGSFPSIKQARLPIIRHAFMAWIISSPFNVSMYLLRQMRVLQRPLTILL